MTNFAAIDVGSNAVRLLIKRLEPNGTLRKQLMLRVPLRLGFDVFETGRIGEEKSRYLIKTMKCYKHLMKIFGVTEYRACATSAMRDAENGKKLIEKILKQTKINIEIIDGAEEARIVYSNHLECTADREGNRLYVDVGGGSTEINLLTDGRLIFQNSYNIGTVRRLVEIYKETGTNNDDKVAISKEWERLLNDLREKTEGMGSVDIIGSGGNINKLYRLAQHRDKKAGRIPVTDLQELLEEMRIISVEERMELFDLKADRADVIVPAAEIFLYIAQEIHSEFIYVPTIGLADGIIDALVMKHSETNS